MSPTQNCHLLCKAYNPGFDIQLKLNFFEEKIKSIYSTQSVSMALYSRILILPIGYIMLSLEQPEHFCYPPSLADDHKLAQKSETIFIAWMITFIKPDQLPKFGKVLYFIWLTGSHNVNLVLWCEFIAHTSQRTYAYIQ